MSGLPRIVEPFFGVTLRGLHSIWGRKVVPLFWEVPVERKEDEAAEGQSAGGWCGHRRGSTEDAACDVGEEERQ